MAYASLSASVRCPRCGASMSTTVDGLCGACLLRLAVVDDVMPPQTSEELTGFDESLAVKGQRIGNYELLDEISRGGMGIVYRARQLTASRTVALKLMLPHLLHLPAMLQRFRHEVEAVAQLDHAGILPIYEVGEHAGLPFFSMKFAEGGALDARVHPLQGDWRAIAGIVAKVADAVEHAHRRGILHRDLKPANILFDASDTPMVADFGLARFRAGDHAQTVPAVALGSPHYMAPEQVSAQFGEVGPATDVYGLGAVLYELLTGNPPIAGEDAAATMRLVPTQPPQPGVRARPDLPADLDAIALKCLAKQPQERFAGAAEVARDLRAWLDGEESSARRSARSRRWQRRAMVVAFGSVLLALTAGGWTYLQSLYARLGYAAPITSSLPVARSIAVLPLKNLGTDRDDDYLSVMVTDDLLRDLRQVDSLDVVPFRIPVDDTGQFQPADLAERLGVNLVLDGDFVRQGQVLKVRARLWDTQSRRATWQYAFNTPANDVRAMRSEIASALVAQMQIQVGRDLRAQLQPDALTESPDAYSNYLRARYLLRWRRHETLTEAARLLHEAITLDDSFAHAHSALAYVYALWIPSAPVRGDHWELAVQHARSALALNPTLGEPHAVLGDHHSIRGRPIDAEIELERALQLDPRDPATLHFYAIHLYSMGRLRDALEMERRSVANDGSSPQPMMWVAMLTTLIGDPQEARVLWQKTDELGAARPLCAAIARLDLGQNEFLPEWYHTQIERTGLPVAMRDTRDLEAGVLDHARRDAALAWLRKVEPYTDKGFLITHYGLLGDADNALRIAEGFNLVDDFWYHYQICNIWSPRTAVIRTDPRFGALVQRWGLVDYWQRFGMPDYCSITSGEVRCR